MLKPHPISPPRRTVGSVRSTRMIKVIELEVRVGAGTQDDPARVVTQFWSEDGAFLAERDTWNEDKEARSAVPHE